MSTVHCYLLVSLDRFISLSVYLSVSPLSLSIKLVGFQREAALSSPVLLSGARTRRRPDYFSAGHMNDGDVHLASSVACWT